MYRNAPKVIMRVELLTNNGIRFDLLLLNEFFCSKEHIKKSFLSEDFFMVESAGFFHIFKSKTICFPRNFKENKNRRMTLMFDTEKIRYKFLKDLNKALIEWSNSKYWSGFNKPNNPKIIYNKNIWILF